MYVFTQDMLWIEIKYPFRLAQPNIAACYSIAIYYERYPNIAVVDGKVYTFSSCSDPRSNMYLGSQG